MHGVCVFVFWPYKILKVRLCHLKDDVNINLNVKAVLGISPSLSSTCSACTCIMTNNNNADFGVKHAWAILEFVEWGFLK